MSETQSLSFEILDDPQYIDVLFGGSAGGAKSFFVCMWAVMQCRNYKGISIGLGRKSLKSLRQTTLATLLTKVHPAMGVRQEDFKFNGQDNYIEYINGSKIILVDMAHAPTDPDYDRFGSLELTHVIVEEVGEAIKKAVDVLSSRRNRMMNKEYGIVGKLIMTCNPTQNFIRQDYWKHYNDQGAGRMQFWEHGNVVIPETGEKKPAYRVFVRSSVKDNPFVDDNYVEILKSLPDMERKRLYDGDWNYADDDDSLFKNTLMDRAMIDRAFLPKIDSFDKFIGVDVADKGKDETIATLVDHGIIIAQKMLDIGMTHEEKQNTERSISLMYADELIKFAQQNGFTSNDAKRIAIEGNGIGVGMRDNLRNRGWFVTIYEATAQTRSQGYYDFSLDMDSGLIKIISDLDDGELRRQLAAHTYLMIDQKPKVKPKEQLKVDLGRSPDNADSAMIANYIRSNGASRHDPKKNASRIRF